MRKSCFQGSPRGGGWTLLPQDNAHVSQRRLQCLKQRRETTDLREAAAFGVFRKGFLLPGVRLLRGSSYEICRENAPEHRKHATHRCLQELLSGPFQNSPPFQLLSLANCAHCFSLSLSPLSMNFRFSALVSCCYAVHLTGDTVTKEDSEKPDSLPGVP